MRRSANEQDHDGHDHHSGGDHQHSHNLTRLGLVAVSCLVMLAHAGIHRLRRSRIGSRVRRSDEM